MKTLVAGWFSFEGCGVTVGDLKVRDVVCEWLEQINYDYDVALAFPLTGGVNWRSVEPASYSHVIFACGPFPYDPFIFEFLRRFESCHLIGINLSMIEPLDVWNPFNSLIERDSSVRSRPDLSFLSSTPKVPTIGVILVHPQPEYGEKGQHQEANEFINRLIANNEVAAVNIDTCLDPTAMSPNRVNLRSPSEVESLIAKMDLIITTRLHGTVLALKNEVPVIAIDPIAGGAKILHQANTIGWPLVFTADNLTDKDLLGAFEFCKTEAAVVQAKECRVRAISLAASIRDEFIAAISPSHLPSPRLDLSYELIEPSESLQSFRGIDFLSKKIAKSVIRRAKSAIHLINQTS
jgi:Polysaccharide pyruvyl transferase